MSLVRKLKPDRNITGALIPLSMLPIFGLSSLIFGISRRDDHDGTTMWVYALFYLYVFAAHLEFAPPVTMRQKASFSATCSW